MVSSRSYESCHGCPVAHRNIHPVLLDIEKHLPVKALFPFAGFWREHQGPNAPPDANPALLRFTHSCWSTDVLVHGSHNFAGAAEGHARASRWSGRDLRLQFVAAQRDWGSSRQLLRRDGLLEPHTQDARAECQP